MKCEPIEIAWKIYGRIDSEISLELEPKKPSSRTSENKFVTGKIDSIGNSV